MFTIRAGTTLTILVVGPVLGDLIIGTDPSGALTVHGAGVLFGIGLLLITTPIIFMDLAIGPTTITMEINGTSKATVMPT